jgi:hypothetical protein
MSSTTGQSALRRTTTLELPDSSAAGDALWLSATTVLALIAFYFIGFDQGAVSVFGADSHVHEFLHDARHVLAFPCH